MRLTNGHQRRPSTCTNHPQKKGVRARREELHAWTQYSVPHSLTHTLGYTVEIIYGWRGSSRDNLTHVVVVHLVEGREPRMNESKFDHDAVACLFLIFFFNGMYAIFFLDGTWIVHVLNDGARDGSHGHGQPYLETTTLVLWCTFKKNYYFDVSCQLEER